MMRIYHDAQGNITHTVMRPAPGDGYTRGTFIEAPDDPAFKLDEWRVENDALVPTGALDERRREALEAVWEAVAAFRKQTITPIVGQEMIYMRKVEEARAVQAASAPVASDYPLLAAEIGISAATLEDVAALILSLSAQWAQFAKGVETARLRAQADIRDATTAAGVTAALAQFNIDLSAAAGP